MICCVHFLIYEVGLYLWYIDWELIGARNTERSNEQTERSNQTDEQIRYFTGKVAINIRIVVMGKIQKQVQNIAALLMEITTIKDAVLDAII